MLRFSFAENNFYITYPFTIQHVNQFFTFSEKTEE